jgi:hypothetical protein
MTAIQLNPAHDIAAWQLLLEEFGWSRREAGRLIFARLAVQRGVLTDWPGKPQPHTTAIIAAVETQVPEPLAS